MLRLLLSSEWSEAQVTRYCVLGYSVGMRLNMQIPHTFSSILCIVEATGRKYRQ
jgi:hypothetical protein